MSGRGKVLTRGRGRGARRTATTAANRGPINPGETRISPPKGKSKKTASPLPPQYSFTPAEASTSVTPRSCVPVFSEGVKDFPPPPQLLTSRSQPGSGNSGTDPRASASPRPSASASEARPSASLQARASASLQPRPSASLQPPPAATQARSAPSPQAPPAATPQAQSSEAQNDHLEEDEEEYDEDYEEVDFDGDEGLQPHLAEDVLDALTNLLIQPGRDQYTTLLSPTLEPGTVW